MDGEAHLALLLDPFPERYATSVERLDLGQIEYVNVVRADRLGELQGGLPQIPQVLASDFDDLTTSFALDEGRFWRVSDHRMKVAAITAGAGWGYVPRPLVEAELRAGTLCATSCFGVSERGARAFALYRRRDLPRGPVAELIWEAAGTLRERA
jgi:DNA-binding transcriptional LysR family regulator